MGSDKTSRAVEIEVDGKLRTFDIDDPKLPDWVEDGAFGSDNYPYDKKLDRNEYERHARRAASRTGQGANLARRDRQPGNLGFEGRDAAGKGGSINATRAYMNPRIGAHRGPAETHRDRARAMVLPALCRSFSDIGRVRDV
jgi:polyphosphate kinase 2 (PPK2 family)